MVHKVFIFNIKEVLKLNVQPWGKGLVIISKL